MPRSTRRQNTYGDAEAAKVDVIGNKEEENDDDDDAMLPDGAPAMHVEARQVEGDNRRWMKCAVLVAVLMVIGIGVLHASGGNIPAEGEEAPAPAEEVPAEEVPAEEEQGQPPVEEAVSAPSMFQIGDFDSTPLAMRFFARGFSQCQDPPKTNDTTNKVLLGSSPGGVGSQLSRHFQTVAIAVIGGRQPIFQGHMFEWFAKVRDWTTVIGEEFRHGLGCPRRPGFHMKLLDVSHHCKFFQRIPELPPALQAEQSPIFWEHEKSVGKMNGMGIFWPELDAIPDAGAVRKPGSSASLQSCMARAYFDRPSEALWRRMTVSASGLGPKDVVIGLHLRYGDKYVMSAMGAGVFKKEDLPMRSRGMDHQIPAKLPAINQLIGALIQDIEQADPSLKVRIFVASDVSQGISAMKTQWGERMLPLKEKVVFHVHEVPQQSGADYLGEEKRKEYAADAVSDWFLLAMSDVLIQPMGSAFSTTAMQLGLQGPCGFTIAELAGIQKDPTAIQEQHKRCVQAVVGSVNGR